MLLLAPTAAAAANPDQPPQPAVDRAAQGTVDLNTELSGATAPLRQAWAADPTTAALPFPPLQVLPAGASVEGTCNPGAPARRPAPAAAWCAGSGEVLLDRDLLSAASNGLTAPAFTTLLTYWLATALAERLLPAVPGSELPRIVTTLQATCVAGELVGASPARPPSDGLPLLNAARAAYGDRYRAVVGSASQRAYALLTGLGASASGSCSSADMAALARGKAPDAALLQRIELLPPPDRAFTSLGDALNSQCQPSPSRPCPRPITSARSSR